MATMCSGAQGEYSGLRVIRAYLDSLGQHQRTVGLKSHLLTWAMDNVWLFTMQNVISLVLVAVTSPELYLVLKIRCR
jgi:hypothetical protein